MRALVLIALTACEAAAPVRGGHRVVSLHDATTETLVALGAADRLVGVVEPIDVTPEVRRAIAGVPRVGGLESIAAVSPDEVVGLAVVAERDPELVARLRERGVDVYLPELRTVEDVYAMADAVAARAGVRADALVTALRARIDHPRTGAPRRVFVYDGGDPPFTAGGRAVLADLIARAGGVDVFAELDVAWSHVSWEAVIARAPELIVIDDYDGEDAAAKRATLRGFPTLARVPTIVLPLGDALGGPRVADGVARLRAAIGGSS